MVPKGSRFFLNLIMKKNVFCFILASIICFLLHLSDPGNGKFGAQEIIGVILVFTIIFFSSKYYLGKLITQHNSKNKTK